MVPLAIAIVGSKSTGKAGGASSARNSTKNKRLPRPRSEWSEDQGDNRDQKHSIQRVIPSMSARRVQGEKQIKCFFFLSFESRTRRKKIPFRIFLLLLLLFLLLVLFSPLNFFSYERTFYFYFFLSQCCCPIRVDEAISDGRREFELWWLCLRGVRMELWIVEGESGWCQWAVERWIDSIATVERTLLGQFSQRQLKLRERSRVGVAAGRILKRGGVGRESWWWVGEEANFLGRKGWA